MGSAKLTGGQTTITLTLPRPTTIDRIMLEEDVSNGHVVASYRVDVLPQSSTWTTFSSGQPIGTKRIDLGSRFVAVAVRLVIQNTFIPNPTVTLSAFAPC